MAVGADLTFSGSVEALGMGGRRSFFVDSAIAEVGVGGITILPFRPIGLTGGLILGMILILGAAIGGGASVTGVGGRWIITFGKGSSTPRTAKSANFSMHHRTS